MNGRWAAWAVVCVVAAGCGGGDSDDGSNVDVDCRTVGYECTAGFSCLALQDSDAYTCAPDSGSGSPGNGNSGSGSSGNGNSGSNPAPEPDPGCFSSAQCGASSICVDGTCREMWDRSYTLTVVSATAGEGDPNGEYWDGFGGAPDLYVSVRIDGDSIGVTSTKQDTYSPEWYKSFNVRFYRTTSLVLRVYDEDLSANDHALDLSVPDLAGAVRDGGGSYSTSGNLGITSLDFVIEPR